MHLVLGVVCKEYAFNTVEREKRRKCYSGLRCYRYMGKLLTPGQTLRERFEEKKMSYLSSDGLGEGIRHGCHHKRTLLIVLVCEIVGVVDNPNQQRTTGTPGNVFAVLKLLLCDLEAVSAGAGIEVDVLILVVLEILQVTNISV